MSEQRDSLNSEKDEKQFFYTEELTSPGNTDWILKPNGTDGMGVTLEISSGSGKVQATTSSVDDCIANTAVAVDWDLGTVSGTVQDSCIQVTAIRAVNESGTIKLHAVAQ